MKNTILYASVIATLGVLLISSLGMSVEAEPNSNSAIKTKGSTAFFAFDDGVVGGLVFVSTLDNSEDRLITYQYQNTDSSEDVSFGFNCVAPSQTLEISKKLEEGKLNFNTKNLECNTKMGPDGIFSLTLSGEEVKLKDQKFSFSKCIEVEGDKVCTKTHGHKAVTDATAEGTAFGSDVKASGDMGTSKAITTHSNK